ncbi:Gmad2 immunoglobulin-like domain-containing protein [Flaviaesturariibacter terrae]
MRSFLMIFLLALAASCGNEAERGPGKTSSDPVQPAGSALPAPPPSTPPPGVEIEGRVNPLRPQPGDTVRSPLVVSGKAPGTWYFEGQFVLKLYDSAQRLLATTPAKAQSEWTTTTLVPFRGELRWEKYRGKGFLVFEADNPSGDTLRDRRERLPLWLH